MSPREHFPKSALGSGQVTQACIAFVTEGRTMTDGSRSNSKVARQFR
jgi:hypothetical protein